jgi:Ca2+/Na+ antiporter
MSRESLIKKRILQYMAAFFVGALVTAREEIVGTISPRTVGVIFLLLIVAGSVFLIVSFKSALRQFPPDSSQHEPPTEIERKKIQRNIVLYQVFIAVAVLWASYHLWMTREYPFLFRFAGLIQPALLATLFLTLVKGSKVKLRRLNTNDATQNTSQGGTTA